LGRFKISFLGILRCGRIRRPATVG